MPYAHLFLQDQDSNERKRIALDNLNIVFRKKQKEADLQESLRNMLKNYLK
jgi:hypothetical protein